MAERTASISSSSRYSTPRFRGRIVEGNAQNALGHFELIGVLGGEEAEESVNSRQTDVARCYAYLTFLLQMRQKGDHCRRVEIRKIQIGDPTVPLGSQDAKSQAEAVTIALNRMGTDATEAG